jgi:hypothetical protein
MQQAIDFLTDTGLTQPPPVKAMAPKGPRAEPAEFMPSESKSEADRAKIRNALETAFPEAVSGLLMRELVPCGATQRISEVRRDYEAEDPPRTVECRRVLNGSLYYLRALKAEETQ